MSQTKTLEQLVLSINKSILNNDLDKALDETKEALNQFPGSHQLHSLKGNILIHNNDFNNALISINQSKDLNCSLKVYNLSMKEYYYKKGLYLYNNNDFNNALENFRKILDHSLDMLEVSYINISNALNKLGRIDEAIDYLKKSLKILPSYHIALNNLANIYIDRKDYTAALPFAEKCYKNEQAIPLYISNYGKVLEGLGDYSKAKDIYYKLLMVDPANPHTFFILGSFLLRINEYEDLITLFCSDINIIKTHSQVLNIFGEAYMAKNNYDEALKYLLMGLDLNNSNYGIHANLVKLYTLINDADKAIQHKKIIDDLE
jgi:tetratricopeptide (TPR) repeat protein